MRRLICLSLFLCAGCGVVESGHRGLLFRPFAGGVQHEVLGPGYYYLRPLDRIDDFDITYSTHREEIHTISNERLTLDLTVSIIYRPVESELYKLKVEIGSNYYDEVLGPEFRSATRGVLARHSYLEVERNNEKIEDEIENEVRRRIQGKHIEISSVTMEAVQYAPEIAQAVRSKLVGEQEAQRQKVALQAQAERAKLEAETTLRKKQDEHKLAEEDSAVARLKAETEAAVKVTEAKAEAEQMTLLAKAHAEERRAEAAHLTPLAVAMAAYEALGKLGGSGTAIMLGDWSRVPSFLFPQNLLSQIAAGRNPPAPAK